MSSLRGFLKTATSRAALLFALVSLPPVAGSAAESTNPPLPLLQPATNGERSAVSSTRQPVSAALTNALASLRVKPGFRIELVAAEPMITAPVAIAFDENGRLFVAEMPGYLDEPAPGAPTPMGRIRVLQDTEEGRFTTNSIYADNLPCPSALACWDGGVFVASAPDILYFKDSRQNGVADLHRAVFTGVGGTNVFNARKLPNNFNWGLDNRIHAASGGVDVLLAVPGLEHSTPLALSKSDFAFDPLGLSLAPEAGPSQSGVTFDKYGHRFTGDFARPLRQPMYEPRYLARNPYFAAPAMRIDVSGPQTAVLAAPPGSASASAALVPAWLASARSGVLYRGDAYPGGYDGNYFVADPQAHVIHRMLLRDNGLEAIALPAPDERTNEFLLSTDASFQPVQIVGGPDGALYVVDYHGGNNSGRIYRVVPSAFERQGTPLLGGATSRELVQMLSDADGWHRDTAARLLCQRRDAASLPWLADALNRAGSPAARLHALRILDTLGALTEAQVIKALSDANEAVREHAVQLVERMVVNGAVSDALWARLKALGSDPAVRVRYQLAFTLGEIQHRPDRATLLAGLIARDPGNLWVRTAIFSSLANGGGEMLVALATEPRFREDAGGQAFLRPLATAIGMRGRLDDVVPSLDMIARSDLSLLHKFALLQSLGEGLQRTRSSLALVDPQERLRPLFDQALAAGADIGAPEALRIQALRLLGVSPHTFESAGDWLLLSLNARLSPALESAILGTLGRFDDSRILTSLQARWLALSPGARGEAVAALLARSSNAPKLLDAIERGTIPPSDVPHMWADFLRTYPDVQVARRAVRVFGSGFLSRADVINQFKPTLRVRANATHGHTVFLNRCATCHRVGTEGSEVGPNLMLAAMAGKEAVLRAVLQPNAERAPGYVTAVLQTRDNKNLIGLLGEETTDTVVLKQPGGTQIVWPRSNVQFLTTQSWSLMPERAEQTMTMQDMADLLEFLAPELKTK